MSFKIINVQHRHCVFTIYSELRHFFLEDPELLGLLFEAVQSVILRMFHKDNKTEKFTPGFILVLHTFGRDLKWNPHIHCLLSKGGIGNSGLWRAKTHFNYSGLSIVLRAMLQSLRLTCIPNFAINIVNGQGLQKQLCVSIFMNPNTHKMMNYSKLYQPELFTFPIH